MNLSTKIVLFVVFLIVQSCSESSKEMESDVFCRNELSLLVHNDSIPVSDFSLFEIRKDTDEKLKVIFGESMCENIQFVLSYHYDSLTQVLLTFNLVNDNNYIHIDFIPRLFCTIFLNQNGEVLLEDQLCKPDSVREKVLSFYQSKIVADIADGNYKKVFFSLNWENAKYSDFRIVVNGVLQGYFDFVELFTQDKFGKSICDLDAKEVNFIKEIIPFNLRTDFYDNIDPRRLELADSVSVPVFSIDMEIDEI